MTETITGGDARRAKRTRNMLTWTLVGWSVTEVLIGVQSGAKYVFNGRLRFYDSDMNNVVEAVFFPMLFFAPGSLAVALAVFLPAAAAIRALTRGRLPGWIYSGVVSILPLLVIFGIGFVLWWTGARHAETFASNLARTGPFHLRHLPFLIATMAGGAIVGWATKEPHRLGAGQRLPGGSR